MKKTMMVAALLLVAGALVGCGSTVGATERAIIGDNAEISREAANRWGANDTPQGAYINANADAWEALDRGVNGGGQ